VGNGRHVLAGNGITFVVIFPGWTPLKYFNAVNVEIIVNRIQNKANDSSVMQSVQAIRIKKSSSATTYRLATLQVSP
jgi:hypothetical protein